MFHHFQHLLFNSARNYAQNDGAIYAGAIAYAALAAIFPLLLIMLVLASPFLQPTANVSRMISRLLDLPGIGDFLSSNIVAVYERRTSLGLTSGLGILLGAGGLFGTIESALNRVWHIQGRGWVKGRLVIFIALVIFAIVLTLLLGLAILGVRSLSQSALRNNFPIYGQTLLALVAPPFIILALFFLAYKFLPNTKVRTRAASIGAIIATLFAEITFGGLSWYLGSISDYSRVYDTAGTVFALLAWLYGLATVFLFGAQICATYEQQFPQA